MQKQVRIIRSPNKPSGNNAMYGITIQKEVAVFASGIYYQAEWKGGDIILESGTYLKPDLKEVKKYQFEDCKIEDNNVK